MSLELTAFFILLKLGHLLINGFRNWDLLNVLGKKNETLDDFF